MEFRRWMNVVTVAVSRFVFIGHGLPTPPGFTISHRRIRPDTDVDIHAKTNRRRGIPIGGRPPDVVPVSNMRFS
jgi:hypothetical protein